MLTRDINTICYSRFAPAGETTNYRTDDSARLVCERFFSLQNMTHAARSSTQALTVIVTFGKWVKARGSLCKCIFIEPKKKCRKQHDVTFVIVSRNSISRLHRAHRARSPINETMTMCIISNSGLAESSLVAMK